jgi:hypothetical protein
MDVLIGLYESHEQEAWRPTDKLYKALLSISGFLLKFVAIIKIFTFSLGNLSNSGCLMSNI